MQQETSVRVRYLVDILTQSYEDHAEIIKIDTGGQLDRARIIAIVEKLRRLIFPGYFGQKQLSAGLAGYYSGVLLEEVIVELTPQVERALCHRENSGGGQGPDGGLPGGPWGEQSAGERPPPEPVQSEAGAIVMAFLSKLPELRDYLASDVSAAFDGDPAAFSKDEIIASYPGIHAITVYRLAHALYELNVPLVPRIMTEYAHSVTGIDIHPGAAVGHHFFIDHGTGIVIGETTIIGSHVKIYQGVTLGGLSTRGGQALKGTKRHPTIEDHVTIYSGASILGGTTVIGEGVVIGSNAFITKSVPEKTRVSVKNPELQFRAADQAKWQRREFQQDDSWDWII